MRLTTWDAWWRGTFAALLLRLNVFPIHIPALRERRDDIPILVRYFVDKFAKSMNRRITRIPESVMDTLVRYAWPGNIRELQNFIERAVILTEGAALRAPLAELREGKSKSAPGAGLKKSSGNTCCRFCETPSGSWADRPAPPPGSAFRARRSFTGCGVWESNVPLNNLAVSMRVDPSTQNSRNFSPRSKRVAP